MPESCTCGTVLVENARFCHRCGRATGGEPEIAAEEHSRAEAVAPAATAQTGRVPLPVGFANPVALRVALVMSLVVVLLELTPGFNLLFVVWWLAGGFCAVLVYQRLTGITLSVGAGARLGLITGLLPFLSVAGLIVSMRDELFQQMAKQDPRTTEVLNNPAALAALFLFMFAIIFAMVVGTCAAGGALGARFAARRNPVAR